MSLIVTEPLAGVFVGAATSETLPSLNYSRSMFVTVSVPSAWVPRACTTVAAPGALRVMS